MEVIEAIGTRRSVRKFLEVPLAWEVVGRVLDCVRLAPTAGNVQDVRAIVILDHDVRAKVAEACYQQYWMSKAPVHIVLAVDPTKNEQMYGDRGKTKYAAHDAASVGAMMLLAAHSQGLATCWIGAFDDDMLRRATGMPDDIQPHIVLALGYPDEKPQAPLKFGIESLVYINQYGNRFAHLPELTGEYSRALESSLRRGKDIIEKAKKHLQRV